MSASGGYILQAVGLESTTAAHGSFTGTIMVLIVPPVGGSERAQGGNHNMAGCIRGPRRYVAFHSGLSPWLLVLPNRTASCKHGISACPKALSTHL